VTEIPLQVDLTAHEIQRHADAVDAASMLGPDTSLPDSIGSWRQATTIGLDTEFVRERTFFPRPGLVQLSDGHRVWLLDPIGRNDFPCFSQILEDSNISKVLHSVGEDLEIFRLLTGSLPQPLFDTQIAAAMLGRPLQCRYEHLVEHCFGVELPGGQARSNWCKRPLSPSLLHYAAQDVIWLPRLQQLLSEALDKHQRLQWLTEDCKRLISAASQEQAGQPLARIKGAGRLDDQALAWLQRLVDWRDSQARERDLPRGFVLRDEAMIELARRAGDVTTLKPAIQTLPHPVRRRYESVFLQLLGGTPPEPVQRPPELTELNPQQRTALKQAQTAVSTLAEELAIDPALIASKRELARVIRGERPDWLDGWRGQLLGNRFERLPG
jgi:ribonuclease D